MQIDNRTSDYRIWTAIVVVLVAVLLATEVMERPGFWSNYARDLVGPPLIYILFRGLHRARRSRKSPFDPYDLVAYVSGVLPIYVADRWRQSTHAPFTDSRQTTPP